MRYGLNNFGFIQKGLILTLALVLGCGALDRFKDITESEPVSFAREIIFLIFRYDPEFRALKTDLYNLERLCGETAISGCAYVNAYEQNFLLFHEALDDYQVCYISFDLLVDQLFPNDELYGVFFQPLDKDEFITTWCKPYKGDHND